MLKTKYIIFDFDGVIVDTEHGRFELLARLLTQFRIDLEARHSVHDIAGIPTEVFLSKAFPILSKKDIKTIIEKRRTILFSDLAKYCAVFRGAVESIKELKKMGFELILATTNDAVIGDELLNRIGISNDFKLKFFRDSIQNPISQKKDYSLLFRKAHLDTQNCVIVEDSIVGVTSAKNNGVYCIAFNRYGNDEIEKLADITISDFKELTALFKSE